MENNNYENNNYENNYESNSNGSSENRSPYSSGSAPQQENYNPYTYNPYAANRSGQEADSTQGTPTGGAGRADGTYTSDNGYNGSAYRQAGSNPYNYGAPAEDAYSEDPRYASPRKAKKEKKAKQSGSFGGKLAKTAAIAVVFGLVAGTVFTGVSYAGSSLLGSGNSGNRSASTGDSSTAKIETQVSQTLSGYAEDLTDVSAIVDEVMPSIVAITNISTVTYQSFWGQSSSYQSESCGSGIIVAQDDEYLYICTNNHVVSGAEELSVKFVDENIVAAETRGTYPSGDLAVVMVKLSDISDETMAAIKVATIGDSSALKVGEPSIAIGNALGYGQSVTTGIISALGRSVTTQDSTTGTTITNDNLIQTDAAINPGNSGGALLNKNGQVIGINSVKYSSTDVEGIGYAIPMEDALPIIQELIDNGSYVDTQTAYLGITGADVTSDIATTYNMPQGVYISSVYDNTGAAEAGLQTGDIITQVDDTEITCMDELKAALANYSAGDTVKLVVYRQTNQGYKGYYVNVTLSSAEVMQNQ